MFINSQGFVHLQIQERQEIIDFIVAELKEWTEESEPIRKVTWSTTRKSVDILKRMMNPKWDIHLDQVGKIIDHFAFHERKWAMNRQGNKPRYRGFSYREIRTLRAYECERMIRASLVKAGLDRETFKIGPFEPDQYAEELAQRKKDGENTKKRRQRSIEAEAEALECPPPSNNKSPSIIALSDKEEVVRLRRENAKLRTDLEYATDPVRACERMDDEINDRMSVLMAQVEELKLERDEARSDLKALRAAHDDLWDEVQESRVEKRASLHRKNRMTVDVRDSLFSDDEYVQVDHRDRDGFEYVND